MNPRDVRTLEDFRRLVPVINKQQTFGNFEIGRLCCGGRPVNIGSVLTSSGHSGLFAFGLYDAGSGEEEYARTDAALDKFFHVRALRPTLLINCLPMGVKVFTRECTLGETSVREDMVTALVKAFGPYHKQVILVGEAGFIKLVLELGSKQGIDWKKMRVNVIVGEEPLAENARIHIEGLLGIRFGDPEAGIVASSMGVAELGLNLFSETPGLVAVRRALHLNSQLRTGLLGPEARTVPMLFGFDPRRVFVEVMPDGQLVLTPLDLNRQIPLIRYATGDVANFVSSQALAQVADAAGIPSNMLDGTPTIAVLGRGNFVRAGDSRLYPEDVKEGIYSDAALAGKTTANFRLVAGDERALVRVQLKPGITADPSLAEGLTREIARYCAAPFDVRCETYESFGSGMSIDFERKFDYTGP